MTIKTRIIEAQEHLNRLEAMDRVYQKLEDIYKNTYMKIVRDSNDDYVSDDDGNYVYREMTEDELNYYPWYDAEKAKAEIEVFKQVISYLENMK